MPATCGQPLLDTRPQPAARTQGPVVRALLQELSDPGGAQSLAAPALRGLYVPL